MSVTLGGEALLGGTGQFASFGRHLLGSPVTSDPALNAETLDIGATVEDARTPEPSRVGKRELPFGTDLAHSLLRNAEDRGGSSLADQLVRQGARLTRSPRDHPFAFGECEWHS
jgi:hypothetical protein